MAKESCTEEDNQVVSEEANGARIHPVAATDDYSSTDTPNSNDSEETQPDDPLLGPLGEEYDSDQDSSSVDRRAADGPANCNPDPGDVARELQLLPSF